MYLLSVYIQLRKYIICMCLIVCVHASCPATNSHCKSRLYPQWSLDKIQRSFQGHWSIIFIVIVVIVVREKMLLTGKMTQDFFKLIWIDDSLEWFRRAHLRNKNWLAACRACCKGSTHLIAKGPSTWLFPRNWALHELASHRPKVYISINTWQFSCMINSVPM